MIDILWKIGEVILGLSLSVGVYVAFIPCLQKIYFSCYHPLFERDQKFYDFFSSLLNLVCVSSTFIFVYSFSGGGLSFYYKVSGQTNTSSEIYIMGIFIGSICFILARVWALYFNHSLITTNFTLLLIIIGVGCVSYVYKPIKFIEVFNDFQNIEYILLYCYGGVLSSIVISELVIKIIDKFFYSKIPVSYLLVRHQLESFENYMRIRLKEEFFEKLRFELSFMVNQCKSGLTSFQIDWITTGGREDIIDYIQTAHTGISELPECKTNVRVICHDTDHLRRALEKFQIADKRFISTIGHFRLIIVGLETAFLGVQFGNDRQTEFPDYTIIIKEPLRIATLKNIFESAWNLSKS